MKIILSSIFFLIQVSLFSQAIDSRKIDPANCRDGENIEYCKTHKLMNKLKSLDKTGRVLMVTHQVVISAITGINVASGVAVAYNLSDGSAVKLSMR